jgi:probable HAF family extracellular repeat protein
MPMIPAKRALAALLITAALSAGAPLARAEIRYEIKDLGTLGGMNSDAQSLNDQGQIVGLSQINASTSYHGFVADGAGMHDLGTFGGAQSEARAINRNGDVVGWAQLVNGDRHAFVLRNGTMIDLGSLAGSPVDANSLNDNGVVVGSYESGSYERAFVWNSGVMQDLGTLGGTDSRAYAINNHGDVVGFARPNDNSQIHACLWRNGATIDLGTLGGWASHAVDINENGKVVGWSMEDPNYIGHAFEWADGVMYDLGSLGGISSGAFSINAAGVVVGVSTDLSELQHAVIWQGGVIAMLDSMIAPGSGWSLTTAAAINESGQIAGYGNLGGGTHAFLLTPLPVLEVPRDASVLDFSGAAPNPAPGSTMLRFSLPRSASVRLRLFDLRGRVVRTLADREFGAGPTALRWDGRDDEGVGLSPGIYWARLEVGGRVMTRALTLLR